MNDQSNVPAVREESRHPLDVLKRQVNRKAEDFKMVLPSHISVEKFQRTIATAALANRQLMDCDRQSLLMSAMKLAQDGLLPDGREAALVPFKTWDKASRQTVWLVQAMPMVYGLRKKILQSGEVISLEVGVVYRAELESGNFIYEIGLEPPIRHRPKLDMTDEQMADDEIIAAYSIARLKNETGGEPYWSVEVMRRGEINKVRQASQTGALGKKTRDGKPIEPKGPWVDWFAEMAKKTVLRRHSKMLPMSGDIIERILADDEEAVATGAAAILEHAPENEGRVLPSRADLVDEDSGETVDSETGEITTDSRGMTDVDEETARALDAGQSNDDRQNAERWVDDLVTRFDGAKNDAERQTIHEEVAHTISELEAAYPDLHERAMKAIPSYYEESETEPAAGTASDPQETAEPEPETATSGESDPYAGEPFAEQRKRLMGLIQNAESADDLEYANSEVGQHYASLPGPVQDELDTAIIKKRRTL